MNEISSSSTRSNLLSSENISSIPLCHSCLFSLYSSTTRSFYGHGNFVKAPQLWCLASLIELLSLWFVWPAKSKFWEEKITLEVDFFYVHKEILLTEQSSLLSSVIFCILLMPASKYSEITWNDDYNLTDRCELWILMLEDLACHHKPYSCRRMHLIPISALLTFQKFTHNLHRNWNQIRFESPCCWNLQSGRMTG